MLVTVGILILLFVVYQLWGTGLWTERAQAAMRHDFTAEQQQYQREYGTGAKPATSVPRTSASTAPRTTTTIPQAVRPAPPIPPDGQAEGWITIPKIGLHMIFVEGVTRDDLMKGPGHYPGTPMPGTIGNAAIAGHRTTYLHPFGDVDKLQPGDDIIIQTVAGSFDYKMYQQLIVKATDTWVVNNTPDAEITLTSCHPKHYAEHRIVIKARLVPAKSAKPAKPRPPAASSGKSRAQALLADGASVQQKSLTPSILWGTIAALVGLAWWWGFRRWRHPATWVAGVVPFLIVLFPFYVYLERALPWGY